VQVLYASLDDAALDASIVPAIRNEIGIVQAWFATQTGGRELDVVTANDGAVDVSPIRMDIDAAQLRERSDAVALVIDELSARRSDSPDDFLVVFVPVRFEHQVRCGEESGGGVAVVWVGSCDEVPSTSSRVLGDGTTVTVAHELVHALGAVARCAPHYGNNGHVIDDPHDLMYDGDARRAAPILLDPGHDDYWKSGNRECQSDVSGHPMWRKA
jgi:hypothetical protein